jgi:HSP20 family protein
MQETAKQQHILVKMYRTAERLMIATPVPGLHPEDIRVKVTADNHLIIDGEVRGMLKDIKELLLDEWSVGSYHRDLELPNTVDAARANLSYGNGVLVVALPISRQTIPADLRLEKTGTDHGGRAGHSGRLTS